jgi:hypothetical protein
MFTQCCPHFLFAARNRDPIPKVCTQFSRTHIRLRTPGKVIEARPSKHRFRGQLIIIEMTRRGGWRPELLKRGLGFDVRDAEFA